MSCAVPADVYQICRGLLRWCCTAAPALRTMRLVLLGVAHLDHVCCMLPLSALAQGRCSRTECGRGAAGVLLAASEDLERSIFRRSVVLLYRHSRRGGARGVILSQPLARACSRPFMALCPHPSQWCQLRDQEFVLKEVSRPRRARWTRVCRRQARAGCRRARLRWATSWAALWACRVRLCLWL